MTLRRIAVAVTTAAASLTVTSCSSVDCVSTDFESRIFRQQVTDPSVVLVKAASIKADGGQYVAGNFQMLDGGKATAVWYIDNGGQGLISRVGAVTEMVAANGADSERFGITTASDGYEDVQGCVE